MIDRIAPRFARYEPLRHAGELMAGLVSGLDRKNCWTITEHRGSATPDALQHLLSRAKWDADAVRDDLRDYVVDGFGDPGAILVVDETGDVKKGTATVGVARQYSGPAWARVDRPRPVPAEVVDRGPGALRRRRNSRCSRVSRPNPHWPPR